MLNHIDFKLGTLISTGLQMISIAVQVRSTRSRPFWTSLQWVESVFHPHASCLIQVIANMRLLLLVNALALVKEFKVSPHSNLNDSTNWVYANCKDKYLASKSVAVMATSTLQNVLEHWQSQKGTHWGSVTMTVIFLVMTLNFDSLTLKCINIIFLPSCIYV